MESLVKDIKALSLAKHDHAATGQDYSLFLRGNQLQAAARRMLEDEWTLESVTAVDAAEGMVVTYHFAHFEQPGRVAFKVLAAGSPPAVPSISHIFQGASWHERETRDFFGVDFTGHPYLLPLLMPPEDVDVHPLAKDKKAALRDLMDLGEVVYAAGEIEALFAEPEPEAEEEAAEG